MSTKPDGTEPNSQSDPAAANQRPEHADTPEAPQDTTSEPTMEDLVIELERQKADLTDRLLRAHAEMDNLRKRVEREKAELAKFAISKFAVDMVGVGDNFERAISAVAPDAAEANATLKVLLDGVQMTERAFLQALERHGVRRLYPAGEQFDPHLHQAVMEQQDPSVPAGSVLQVYQAGYAIDERVLRPAMVVVARGGPKAASTSEPAPPANDDAPGEAAPPSAGEPPAGEGSQG
ncbi:MAG: hypothetical protein RLZ98_741 [Pseudomonadota bacterium]